MMWFWWLRHSDIFDVTSSEDYIFINFIFGWHWSVCVPVLCPIGFNCWEISGVYLQHTVYIKEHTARLLNIKEWPCSLFLVIVKEENTRVIYRPLNLPLANATVDLSVSTDDSIPSYRICALDIRLILLPIYGVPPPALMFTVKICF